jgi:hypothetical protein
MSYDVPYKVGDILYEEINQLLLEYHGQISKGNVFEGMCVLSKLNSSKGLRRYFQSPDKLISTTRLATKAEKVLYGLRGHTED